MTAIKPVISEKRKFLDLLLLADEQEDMVMRYLDRGEMFTLEADGTVCGVCVVTDEGNSVCELKNIAVSPDFQRKGGGRQLIEFVEKQYAKRFDKLIVGTGDSPLTVPFYKSCGFTQTNRIKNFFIDNYDHPIFEAGIQLIDMVYFEKKLTEE